MISSSAPGDLALCVPLGWLQWLPGAPFTRVKTPTARHRGNPCPESAKKGKNNKPGENTLLRYSPAAATAISNTLRLSKRKVYVLKPELLDQRPRVIHKGRKIFLFFQSSSPLVVVSIASLDRDRACLTLLPHCKNPKVNGEYIHQGFDPLQRCLRHRGAGEFYHRCVVFYFFAVTDLPQSPHLSALMALAKHSILACEGKPFLLH